MKPIFCPKCHKRITPPEFIKNANISGNIILSCGDNKCKGKIKIKNNHENNN